MGNTQSNGDAKKEESPIISNLSPVSSVFDNRLDANSFVRLAMTNKKLFSGFIEERMIKNLRLEEKEVIVTTAAGVITFYFNSFDVADNHIENYLQTLRQMKFKISLKRLIFRFGVIPNWQETRDYLQGIGVRTIDDLILECEYPDYQGILSLIKDFYVKNVEIFQKLPKDVLITLLQMSLTSFLYNGAIDGEIFLQTNSMIPYISLPSLRLSSDVFTQILKMIETDVLKTLTVDHIVLSWDDLPRVQYNDKDVSLPRDSFPLLIQTPGSTNCWFLHSNGVVTKCSPRGFACEISKCDPEDYPLVLVSKEMVHAALNERREIKCFKSRFESFFDEYTVIEADYDGDLSEEERPLLFKIEEYCTTYFLLKEDGSIDTYTWEEDAAKYAGGFDMETKFLDSSYNHFPLKKYVLDKAVEKRAMTGSFDCESIDVFCKLFNDYAPFSHDFTGRRGNRCYPAFENIYDDNDGYYVVLYTNGTLAQYHYHSSEVTIEPCPAWNFPVYLHSNQHFKDVLLETAICKDLAYKIDFAGFNNAFNKIKTFEDVSTEERPVKIEKTQFHDGKRFEERWLLLETGEVKKCAWKDGEAMISHGDPAHFPPTLTKTLIKDFLKGKPINTAKGLFIDRDILKDCLGEFDILQYDDATSLREQRPLIFQKTEIKHTCKHDLIGPCKCIEEILHLWFFSENTEVTHITYGEKGDRQLIFYKEPNVKDVPLALRSKEMLDCMLKETCPSTISRHWHGSSSDFNAYFNGHRRVFFHHDGRLPRTRPLVFVESYSEYFLLRKDGVLIHCVWGSSDAMIWFHPEPKYCPPALQS